MMRNGFETQELEVRRRARSTRWTSAMEGAQAEAQELELPDRGVVTAMVEGLGQTQEVEASDAARSRG